MRPRTMSLAVFANSGHDGYHHLHVQSCACARPGPGVNWERHHTRQPWTPPRHAGARYVETLPSWLPRSSIHSIIASALGLLPTFSTLCVLPLDPLALHEAHTYAPILTRR